MAAQLLLQAFQVYFSEMKLTNFALALLAVIRDVNVSSFALHPLGKSVGSHLSSLPLPAQKKRKRKQPPVEPESPMGVPSASVQGLVNAQEDVPSDDDAAVIRDVANFEFKPESFIPMGMSDKSYQGCMSLPQLTLIAL